MYRYEVTAPGFFGGRLYHPTGKRQVLETDVPFKKGKLPSWVTEMPKESSAVRVKREAQAESQAAADAEQHGDDQQEITEASFLGDGESAGGAVETI